MEKSKIKKIFANKKELFCNLPVTLESYIEMNFLIKRYLRHFYFD